jgi:hypothetical protein
VGLQVGIRRVMALDGLLQCLSGPHYLHGRGYSNPPVGFPPFGCLLVTHVQGCIEYVDNKIEFEFFELNISSIRLLPKHVFIRNITDVEISTPSEGASSAAFGALTHVRVKGLHLSLSQPSFYYRDLTTTV